MLHQLALVTAIRQELVSEYDSSKGDEADAEMSNENLQLELLKNTELMPILHRMLAFSPAQGDETQTRQDELYFLQHEALWVLIVLSLGSADVVEHTLQEVELPSAQSQGQVFYSHILDIVSGMALLAARQSDWKMLHSLLNFMGNCACSGKLVCLNIMQRVDLKSLFHALLGKISSVPADILELTCWLNSFLAKSGKIDKGNSDEILRHLIVDICETGIARDHGKSLTYSLNTLRYLADTFEEEIPFIAK